MAKNLTTDLASAATTTNAADNTGGVAVMEPAVTPGTPGTTPGTTTPNSTKGSKKGGKSGGGGGAKGNIASVAERAAVQAEPGTPGSPGTNISVIAAQLTVLDEIADQGIKLRSPETPAGLRTIAKEAALEVAIGVGLGAKSGGHGPLVRVPIKAALCRKLNKVSLRAEDYTRELIEEVLQTDNFQAQALVDLDAKLLKLKTDAGANTLKVRAKNESRARLWIETGMHKSYLTALDVIRQFGDEVKAGGARFSINRALAMAFGHNYTAAEFLRELKKDLASASELTQAKAVVAAAA